MAASVRYIVHDVAAAFNFYTRHLGFKLEHSAALAFALVTRRFTTLVKPDPHHAVNERTANPPGV
jgi:catechol 2,3-dioxygenase-like lactoylglutathione lyase family enzyme